jgi:tRNA (adenine22-N1)-methyltransferase
MEDLHLASRLKKIAEYLPKGAKFADIGSDHAYLPVYVCLHDSDAYAIAGEINRGPYHSARRQVEKWNLTDRIDVRLGDGLDVFEPNEVKQVVLAGMGGTLITSILDRGKEKLENVDKIIAQPNINARSVRKWMYSHDYILVDEQILEEDGYIYEILVGEKKPNHRQTLTEKEYFLGPFLLKERNSIFRNKWEQVLNKKKKIVEQMRKASNPDYAKIAQFQLEIQWLKEVLHHE